VKPNLAESQANPTVVVIGGGASGTLATIRLLESARSKRGEIRIVLIEKNALLGRGVAYGTEAPFHILNVRQNKMSAYPEDEDHFTRWLARTNSAEMKNPFQPRRRYAEYLASVLNDARRSAPSGIFTVVNGEAEKFTKHSNGKIEIQIKGVPPVVCDRFILATGHRSPGVPEGLAAVKESGRFLADPWDRKIDGIGKNETVLVVGSGLTAVDFVLSRMRAGHANSIDVISRHGLSPLGHVLSVEAFPLKTPFADESVRGVVRELRIQAHVAGDRWPHLMDRFRTEVQRVWGSWLEPERRRFLRHVRSYWETHRHRVAPEVYREWDLYVRGGKVKITSGRIVNSVEAGDGILVRMDARHGGKFEKRYDRVVNCTGAAPDLRLLVGHEYLNDPLGLGIPTDLAGRPFRADGELDSDVFVLSPALRTTFWEMTSIPELRDQAKFAVETLLGGMR
jgi:uncharacterized NAD(P)/FAD-binding protein YdhS